MALFNKSNKPIFLKDTSDAEEYLSRLKELYKDATGKTKSQIELEIRLVTYGLIGEKNIAFELSNSGMPMYILHDIHLELEDLSAQIDYIVVTKKVIYVIECKNLIGNITIDRDGNFIRDFVFGGRKIREGIYSPITQNQRHLEVIKQIKKKSKTNVFTKFFFEKYFNDNYKSIVVLANPKTILNARYAKKDVKDKVIRADQLIRFIKDTDKASENLSLKDGDMKSIALGFLELHTPNKTEYAAKFEKFI